MKCESKWVFFSETHIRNVINHSRVEFSKKSYWSFAIDIFLQNCIHLLKIKHMRFPKKHFNQHVVEDAA